jgi:hypothetical protein
MSAWTPPPFDLPEHDALTVIEDQDRPLIWIPAPSDDDLWDPAVAAWVPRPRLGCLVAANLLVGLLIGLALGIAVMGSSWAQAAPRSTSELVVDPTIVPGSIGAPRSGMPVEDLEAEASREAPARAGGVGAPTITEPGAIMSGTLAYAKPSFGARYLAIPEGPGVRVRICAPRGCLERVSTDAGPALFRQREGRLADVSYVDFAWLCGCTPETLGLIREASIEYLGGPGVTPPHTDAAP